MSAPSVIRQEPVVIGTDGLDVADIVRYSRVPVMIERPAPAGAFAGDILVISDGTTASRLVVAAAGAFVEEERARPLLLFTGRRSRIARRELAEQSTTLRELTGAEPVALSTVHADALEITRIARDLRVAVIALAASGLATEVVRSADCSVLVVP